LSIKTHLYLNVAKTKSYANQIHEESRFIPYYVICYIVISIPGLVLWFYVLTQNDLKGWKKNYSDCQDKLPYLVQLLL
jgi:hypothetical protein